MKTGEVEVNCYEKMYGRWLRLPTMLLPGLDLHWVGPLALWDFWSIFLPNTGEDQKNSYMSAWPLELCHMLNPSLVNGYCITFIKRLHEGLSCNFWDKNPYFHSGCTFNCLANIKLKGHGPLDQYCCWGPIWIGSHLNIIVGGPFKLVGKMKLRGSGPLGSISLLGAYLNITVGDPFKLADKNWIEGPGLPGSVLLLGAHLNWWLFKYYCRGLI